MEVSYVTTRSLENSKGEVKGRIRIIVYKGENEANIEYTCPECGFSEKKKEIWKKPFRTKCSNCGYSIKVTSLRAEIKRMRRKRK